jgi:hypothetical protein
MHFSSLLGYGPEVESFIALFLNPLNLHDDPVYDRSRSSASAIWGILPLAGWPILEQERALVSGTDPRAGLSVGAQTPLPADLSNGRKWISWTDT